MAPGPESIPPRGPRTLSLETHSWTYHTHFTGTRTEAQRGRDLLGLDSQGVWGWLGHPRPAPQGTQAPRQLGRARLEGRSLPGRGAAIAALAGARGAAAAERGGAVGVPHAHGGRGAPGGGKKGQVLVLAGGQLRTLGEHCQAAAAQSAPTSGSPPGEKQRRIGDAQTG